MRVEAGETLLLLMEEQPNKQTNDSDKSSHWDGFRAFKLKGCSDKHNAVKSNNPFHWVPDQPIWDAEMLVFYKHGQRFITLYW